MPGEHERGGGEQDGSLLERFRKEAGGAFMFAAIRGLKTPEEMRQFYGEYAQEIRQQGGRYPETMVTKNLQAILSEVNDQATTFHWAAALGWRDELYDFTKYFSWAIKELRAPAEVADFLRVYVAGLVRTGRTNPRWQLRERVVAPLLRQLGNAATRRMWWQVLKETGFTRSKAVESAAPPRKPVEPKLTRLLPELEAYRPGRGALRNAIHILNTPDLVRHFFWEYVEEEERIGRSHSEPEARDAIERALSKVADPRQAALWRTALADTEALLAMRQKLRKRKLIRGQ